MPVMTREQVASILNKKTSPALENHQNQKDKFLKRINLILDNELEDITDKDWYNFFVYKANEHKIAYFSDRYMKAKECAVLKSLMANYDPPLIKAMIEWVWDGKHTLMKKEEMSIFVLSKGFLRTVVPMATKYMQGLIDKYGVEYDPRIHISKNKKLDEGGSWIAGRKVT